MSRLIDDGNLSTPRQRNPPRFVYPFQNFPIPDRWARIITRNFIIRPPDFRPATAGRTDFTNLLKASNSFNDAGQWTAFQATPAASGFAPDGQTGWKLTEDAVLASTHGIKQDFSFPDSHNYVRYLLVKAGERSRIELTMLGSVNVARGFDVESGVTFANTLSHAEPSASGMAALEDGWFLCWISQTLDGGISSEAYMNDGAGSTYDGDNTKGIFIAYDHLVPMALSDLKPVFATTTEARTISAPMLDPGDAARAPDPFAFLTDESEPSQDQAGRTVWDRIFARVPAQQVTPSSLMISKPDFSGTFPQRLGGYIIFQNDPSIARYDGYFNAPVITDSGAPDFPTTGGTYTLTFEGDTTLPLAFDADASTVEIALNLLASVIARGGLTVSGVFSDPDGFLITWNDYAPNTPDGSALTIASTGSIYTAPPVTFFGGFYQLVQFQAVMDLFNGGTFTLTVFGQTTAPIAYDATTDDVKDALELLSEVAARGGVEVGADPMWGGSILSIPPNNIGFNFTFSNPAFTGDASSLLPVGAIITGTPTGAGNNTQRIKFQAPATRTLITQIPHGMNNDSRIYIKDASNYFNVFPGTFTILDATTIQLNILATYPYASIGTITDTGRLTRADYAPGAVNVRVSKARDFYLPGVTPGIATSNDIPVPAGQSENSAFLEAVFSGVGTLNWSVGAIEQWRGPILVVETTKIQASDL